jgi:hypothetical protein
MGKHKIKSDVRTLIGERILFKIKLPVEITVFSPGGKAHQ